MIGMTLHGDKELSLQLKGLSGPMLRRAATAGVRGAMKPTLAHARRLTPTHTRRLRASIGVLVRPSRRRQSVTGRVGFRRDFTFVSTGKDRIVSGAGKNREKGLARGLVGDKKQVNLYAAIVEFGSSKGGRVKRRAGGAQMLNTAIRSQSAQMVGTVASSIRSFLEKHRT